MGHPFHANRSSAPFQNRKPVGERLHFRVKRSNRCCVAPLAHFEGRIPFVKLRQQGGLYPLKLFLDPLCAFGKPA